MTESAILDVWINCPDAATAQRIADALVEERLVACANVLGPIRSTYHWQGAIERDDEVPLLLKTRAALFDRVVARVEALHPYDVPSILGVPIERVNEAYATWVSGETRGD